MADPQTTGCNFCGHEWGEVDASRCPECGHSDLRTIHQSTDLITLAQALRATPAIMAEEAAARIDVLEAESAELRAENAQLRAAALDVALKYGGWDAWDEVRAAIAGEPADG